MILNAKEILKQLYNCCDLIEERLLDGDEKPGYHRGGSVVFKRTDGQKRHGGSVATCLL